MSITSPILLPAPGAALFRQALPRRGSIAPPRQIPTPVMITPFEEWLALGMAERNPPSPVPPETLASYYIRFNTGIARIRMHWTDDELARALWYLYGAGSCQLCELEHLPPSPLVNELFASLEILYRDLFEANCTHTLSHLDRDPESAQPLNTACYMLWDMDCGLDIFWRTRVPEHVDLTLRTLEQLGRGSHPAVLESVIHGLGHILDDHREACQPILDEMLTRRGLSPELRDYVHNAIHHYIQ